MREPCAKRTINGADSLTLEPLDLAAVILTPSVAFSGGSSTSRSEEARKLTRSHKLYTLDGSNKPPMSSRPYSPECVEGEFCEVRPEGVLRIPPSAWTRASAKYNGAVGYLISAAEGQTSVNLTDPQWRALVYVASLHGFSAPHLRLEAEDETLEVNGSDAERLRDALGAALEARGNAETRTPDGELDYDTIQRIRHVLRSGGVRLARPRAYSDE
jgi:hypothetical protein